MSILVGDCVEVMAGMEPESVDAVVTDPPYGLEFRGKEWEKTAVAAAGCGFQWIGSERDPEYIAIAEQRLGLFGLTA